VTPADGTAPGRDPARKSRAVRWAIMVGVASMLSMGLVLMFMLTQATNNRALYEENYARLFAVNMVVAVLLFGVLLWIAWRLISRVRRGRFGSRLLVKLAAIFALVGFVPGVLIYVVSYQFVSRSIESWFDVKVETALDAGLNLGRSTLEVMAGDLGSRTRAAGAQLSYIRCGCRAGAGAHPRPAVRRRRGLVEQRGPDGRQRRQVTLPAQP